MFKHVCIAMAILLTSCVNAYPPAPPNAATVYTYHKHSTLEGFHTDSRIVKINEEPVRKLTPHETHIQLAPGDYTFIITTRFRPTPVLWTQTKDATITHTLHLAAGQQYFYRVSIEGDYVQGWFEDHAGNAITTPQTGTIYIPKLRSPTKNDLREMKREVR